MKTKMEQFPANNPNPVLRAEKDGTVLYSNVAGEPLLHEWGVGIGEKLPSCIGDFVQKVISRNSPEKMEVKVGKRVYSVAFHPLPDEEFVNIYGFDISDQKELEEKYHNIIEKSMPCQVLLDENHALRDEIQSLRARLEEPEELQRAISEGDLDALVMPVSEEDMMVFTLNSADQAYRILMETANEDVLIVDAEFKITNAGKRLINKIGYSQEEVIGRSWLDFVDEGSKVYSDLRMKKRGQCSDENYELKLIRQDGSPLWILASSKPLFDENGKFKGALAMLTDITERKRAEEALQKQAELIDLSPDGIITRQLDGTITFWSKGAQSLYGWTSQEAIGQQIHILLKAQFPQPLEQIVEQVQQTGYWSGELTHFTKDGRQVFVQSRWQARLGDQGNVREIMESSVDVTDRKRAEEALRESEARLQVVIAHSPDIIFEQDRDLRYNWIFNPASPYAVSDVLGKTDAELLPPDQAQQLESIKRRVLDKGIREQAILQLAPGGELRWYEAIYDPRFNEAGQVIGVLSYTRDITERKKAEEKLAAAHSQIQSIIDNTPDIIYAFDLEERFVLANTAVANLFNSMPDRLIGKRRHEFMPKMDADWHEANDQQVFEAGRVLEFEEYSYLEGRSITWLTKKFPLRDVQGRIYTVAGISTDITERKKAEEAIWESRAKLEAAIESMTDAVFISDEEGNFIDFNSAFAAFHRFNNKKECYREFPRYIDIFEGYFPDGTLAPVDMWPVQRALRGETATDSELIVRRKDTGETWIASYNFAPIRDKDGVITGSVVVARDITERKKLEEQIRQRAEELETVMEVAPVAIWIGHDPQSHDITGNRMANEFYEAEPGENVSANITPVRRFFYKGHELTADELPMQQASLNDIDVRNAEFDVLLPSGEYRALLGSASPLHDAEGHVRGSVGAFIDITKRKRAEEKLREAYEKIQKQSEELQVFNEELQVQSEELHEANEALQESEKRFRTLAENSPDVITRFDRQNRHMYANPAASKAYGFSQEEIIGKTHGELGRNPELVKFLETYQEIVFTTGKPEAMEFYYKSPQGKEYYFNTQIVPEFTNGKVTSTLAISRDITDIKEAETKLKETLDNLEELVKERTLELEEAYKSLKESEKGLAEAQKMAHLGNWDWNLVTNKIHWSDEIYRIFGLDPLQFGETYDSFLNYVHPDDRDYVHNAAKKALNGEPYSIDHRIILASGDERVVHVQAEVIFDEKNNPIRIRGTVQDITEREQMEKALHESETRLRRFYESGIVGALYFKMDGSITEANDKFLEMVGYTREDLKAGRIKWDKMTPPEYRPLEEYAIAKLKATGVAKPYEKEYIRKDGSRIPIILGAATLDEARNEGIAFVLDITNRKKAEGTLAKIEIARKKEIHHRIKNNLQVISSLLDLQAEQFRDKDNIKDSEILQAFRESQDRVMSMALIHEELYKSGGFDTLDFSPYIEELAHNLFLAYRLGNIDISLKMDLEENLFFDMDTAVPLGMIVNELISNSFKHAFIGRDKGEIRIKFHREEPTELDREGYESTSTSFTLSISDNGVGIPDDLDIEDLDSLGFQLVTSLVDQLDGEFELKRNNGTEFIIRFTVVEKINQKSAPASQQLVE